MEPDLYTALGAELRMLFKEIKSPNNSSKIRKQMESIVALASLIGGGIQEEALQLKNDLEKFLKYPEDSHNVALMKKHALRLEQETREL